jgi:hypothetical protein
MITTRFPIRLLTAVSLAVAAACAARSTGAVASAGGPAGSGVARPASGTAEGLYEWTMHDQATYSMLVETYGQPITGTLRVVGLTSGLHGVLTSSIGPEFPARSVLVRGDTLTVLASTPYGEFRIEMQPRTQPIAARWSLAGGEVGDLAGPLEVRRLR